MSSNVDECITCDLRVSRLKEAIREEITTERGYAEDILDNEPPNATKTFSAQDHVVVIPNTLI